MTDDRNTDLKENDELALNWLCYRYGTSVLLTVTYNYSMKLILMKNKLLSVHISLKI